MRGINDRIIFLYQSVEVFNIYMDPGHLITFLAVVSIVGLLMMQLLTGAE
jgi:hypothetical protein